MQKAGDYRTKEFFSSIVEETKNLKTEATAAAAVIMPEVAALAQCLEKKALRTESFQTSLALHTGPAIFPSPAIVIWIRRLIFTLRWLFFAQVDCCQEACSVP